MLLNAFLAYCTVLFTGITLRIPRSAWFTVGIAGMLGWTANRIALNYDLPRMVAVVVGAMVVGSMAEVFARIQKQPVTVYIVSGIIPLVPGIMAYNSMLAFMEDRFSDGLILLFRAFLIASYLAAGLAIPSLIVRNLQLLKSQWARKR